MERERIAQTVAMSVVGNFEIAVGATCNVLIETVCDNDISKTNKGAKNRF